MIYYFARLLAGSSKREFLVMLASTVIMALTETLGVASIMPFITLLIDPSLVFSNSYFVLLFGVVDFENRADMVLVMGVSLFVFYVITLCVRAFASYVQLRFVMNLEINVGSALMRKFLFRSFSKQVQVNSSDAGKTLLSELSNVVHGGLTPIVLLFSQTIVAAAILLLLALVNFGLSVSVIVSLGIVYVAILMLVKDLTSSIGRERAEANKLRFQAVAEALGGFREVKLLGLEDKFLMRFEEHARTYAKNYTTAQLVGQMPRYLLEGIAFGGILIVVLYLTITDGGFSKALPVVSLYAFAGYKLMPALQQIYGSLIQLRFIESALVGLVENLDEKSPTAVDRPYKHEIININCSVAFNSVCFKYPGSSTSALSNVSFNIQKGQRIAFVGASGSGKTTAANVLLGLLEPYSGEVLIDGLPLRGSEIPRWQRLVGYVPQDVFLLDASLAENIAFGLDKSTINHELLVSSAKRAGLSEFIEKTLPDGFDTRIGERGAKLSGGQRQRVGIARALYREPFVLVLDEATSSLDTITETYVTDQINSMHDENLTIIVIAHRLSTIRNSDMIFVFEQGAVTHSGTYSDLQKTSMEFFALSEGQRT